MEDGRWEIENGKWEIENGKWKMCFAIQSNYFILTTYYLI